ncbi:40S ribosomal protein S8 [Vitis vinifera]|uniref:40S ribosomal protein S8 n=1 Tax=Vitis vinifera TaxID=29760 RepID=A0A438HW58_VITVI|nr:40S ribosomal protein S8 [Vitis vinifera]
MDFLLFLARNFSDSMHKRRATGGKKKAWRKKRNASGMVFHLLKPSYSKCLVPFSKSSAIQSSCFTQCLLHHCEFLSAYYDCELEASNTKLSSNKTVRRVRVRGGNVKWRALRLDTGNYSWGSEAVTRKTRILDVVYNASNNELVRTQTLVKSAIVQVDAAPFKQWYLQHYGVDIGRKKKAAAKKETTEEGEAPVEETKKSSHVLRKLEKRQADRKLDPHIEEQFSSGRLLACISSRPGQCGRADGYILEGKELEFYTRKIQRKKGKGAGAAA